MKKMIVLIKFELVANALQSRIQETYHIILFKMKLNNKDTFLVLIEELLLIKEIDKET